MGKSTIIRLGHGFNSYVVVIPRGFFRHELSHSSLGEKFDLWRWLLTVLFMQMGPSWGDCMILENSTVAWQLQPSCLEDLEIP